MRPLVAGDAFLRTYVGDDARYWVLVRRPGLGRTRLDSIGRTLVELSDGTRSVEQLAVAASERLPRPVSARQAQKLLEPLFATGALVDGAAEQAPVEPRLSGLEQVELAPGYVPALVVAPRTGFDCDGRGSCCELYDRLSLDGDDIARARQAYGDDELTPGGLLFDSAIVHEGGDVYGLAVIQGACTLLESDSKCGVHKRLGAAGKPASCRQYPIRDVLCGDELHVGVGVECRCAVDFAGGPSIDAAAAAALARRLHTRTVEAVKDQVVLAGERPAPRAEYLRWRAAARARLAGADPLLWALDEAAALAGDGPRGPTSLRPGAEAAFDELRHEAADTAAVYAERDLQRRLFAWGEAAARRLCAALADGSLPGPVDGEALLAGQALHTHGLLRGPSLALGLRWLALRLALARAATGLPIPPELHPVSAVEYLGRVYRIGNRGGAVI